MIFAYYGNWDYWQLYHKITFDGVNKLITVNPGELIIDVKNDIYSSWKEWSSLRDYAKFLPAIRTIGGDPTPTGYAGDMYFLTNGWQIVIPHEVNLSGILYHDDPIKPYIVQAGGGVIATVSNLALGTTSSGGATAVQVRQEIDTNSTKLANTLSKLDIITSNIAAVPTANEISSAVRTELTTELTKINSQVDGLTPAQLTLLTSMYELMGLDPTKPLIVTPTSVTAGSITQVISGDNTQTMVTRSV